MNKDSDSNNILIAHQVNRLIQKIEHYLITSLGRIAEEASLEEFYCAFSNALREEIMINWAAQARTLEKNNGRILYYFSMEYLPGRILGNNLTNINTMDLVKIVMKKMNRNLNEVIECEHDPGLGNGGLGRLASCFLDSLATLHLPAMGYGLRYHYGIFEQQLWDGVQMESPDCWLLNENPWEFRRDQRKVSVKFGGLIINKLKLEDYDAVRALPYDYPIVGYSPDSNFSVVTLRLWTTKESPRNFKLHRFNAGRLGQAGENIGLTDILYPEDSHETGKRIRLKQEFLLVSASLQDLIARYLRSHNDFEDFADKVRIQINDTHPTLVIPELIRLLTYCHNIPWEKACDITRTCTSYTNHTILGEALEEWDINLFGYLLPRQLKIIEKLNLEFCKSIRKAYPHNEEKVRRMSIIEHGKIRMAPLAIYGSHHINGVAKLHTSILKKSTFKDFVELYPDRFVNVTNGVTQRRWILRSNPRLAEFISERIGESWINDFSLIKKIARYADDTDTQNAFLKLKKQNKDTLISYLKTHSTSLDATGNPVNTNLKLNLDLDPSSLFDVQIKRFHEYKRQLLNALHLIMLYHELRENPTARLKRTAIISGKAAAGYKRAKAVIRLICCIARKINNDPDINGALKVVFVENYGVSKAQMIIPAADLSEQISTAGMEASGTGNMKLTINGALTIGTDDGANIEMKEEVGKKWWPFTFGCSSKEIADMQLSGGYNPWDIYATNSKIHQAVDTLRDHTFADNESEHNTFSALYHYLLEGHDPYFVLKDLPDYYNTQKSVETLYAQPNMWAQYVLNNIAGMSKFSSDESIRHYNELIWGLHPCPPDPDILAKVSAAYAEHDRCRILEPQNS